MRRPAAARSVQSSDAAGPAAGGFGRVVAVLTWEERRRLVLPEVLLSSAVGGRHMPPVAIVVRRESKILRPVTDSWCYQLQNKTEACDG